MKPCPDCAEQVQAEARVCRYCGYRFDGSSGTDQVLQTVAFVGLVATVLIPILFIAPLVAGGVIAARRQPWLGAAVMVGAIAIAIARVALFAQDGSQEASIF